MLTLKRTLHASCVLFFAVISSAFSQEHLSSVKVLSRAEPVVRMVLQEANNEPFMGLVTVAGVALDRKEDPRWPNTKEAVVRQPGQFEGMQIKIRNYGRRAIARARIAVKVAARGYRPCGTVYWYHATYVKPRWDYSKIEFACQIGEHVFYRDKE